MTDSSSMRDLAKRLSQIEQRVRAISAPQLAYSSIENGALRAHDDALGETMHIGLQWDGTYAPTVVRGPKPPTPSVPIGTDGIGAFTVAWDGLFADDALVPMDFLRIDVHFDPSPSFDPDNANRAGSIAAASGGQLTVGVPEGVYYAKLVCWTLGGKFSDPSEAIMVQSTVPTGGGGGTDGFPPASSPAASVLSAIKALYVQWSPISNADPVTYEVHMSTTSGFTPDSTTLAGEIAGTFFQITNLPDGSDLPFSTTYYVKLVAKDGDGAAAPGAEASGNAVQIPAGYLADGSVDTDAIAPDAVTASQLADGSVQADAIGTDAVTAGKIVAGAVTTAKLATGAVTTNELAAGAVTAINIAAATITSAEIAANAIGTAQLTANAVTAAKIATGTITANELAAGAITTSKLAAGAVTTTELAANAVTAAKLDAAAITGKTITGGVFRTATSGRRMQIDSASSTGRLTFFSGFASEVAAANIEVNNNPVSGYLNIQAPTTSGVSSPPNILLATATSTSDTQCYVYSPNSVSLIGDTSVVLEAPQAYFNDWPMLVGGPYWYGYLNATQSAPAASTLTTSTQWAELENDQWNACRVSSGGLFTFDEPGVYRLGGQFWWAAWSGSSGTRLTQLIHTPLSGGATVIASITVDAKASGAPALAQWNKLYRFAAGDGMYIRYQWIGATGGSSPSTGNGSPTGTSQDISFFQIQREKM